ncbi:olfactory receptor 5V1-like [Dipodomys spectabilis]|uniref:olfactory receptor 5V1-like n=1 Tax=Dipodomys spectabilis TaxID=105255 RepID=UPI001C53B9E8|nr:olfactory receptor 5V1-like [Dipodomys spectabilis]
MEGENQTSFFVFIIMGFSNLNHLQFLLFTTFLMIYLCTLGGNTFIILMTLMDSRLHTPMYFFLRNLAFLDICYTTTNVPQMMVHLLSEKKSISFGGCVTQFFAFLSLVGVECLLLATMAYDRYIAICKPLRYLVIMHKALYSQLAASCWVCGFLNSVVHTVMTFRLPFCGNNKINYFFCDIPPLLVLSCGDTSVNELVILFLGVFIGWAPFLGIILSYIYIISTILKIHSSKGRKKAFSTCASHLLIVLLYFGSAIFTYGRPISSYSLGKDRLISVLYSVVTPMLNPIIYTLRNKDIRKALRTVAEKIATFKSNFP